MSSGYVGKIFIYDQGAGWCPSPGRASSQADLTCTMPLGAKTLGLVISKQLFPGPLHTPGLEHYPAP
jgi:hypothetical protein